MKQTFLFYQGTQDKTWQCNTSHGITGGLEKPLTLDAHHEVVDGVVAGGGAGIAGCGKNKFKLYHTIIQGMPPADQRSPGKGTEAGGG